MDFTQINLCLSKGSLNAKKLCLMQMVSYFAAEEITDHPLCACPILTSYGIGLNDRAPTQELRNTLWPLVFQLVGSKDSDNIHSRKEMLKTAYINFINVGKLFRD